ncbi:MAG: HEAT repeat domain-containing protein [Ktedonobacterales bacterium]
MNPRESSSHFPADQTHRSASSAVPESVLAGLQVRLEAYRQARATPFAPTDLEAALRDPRWEIRCAAAEHLTSSSPQAQLEQVLDDEEYCVRQAAVRALGRMGSAAPLELFHSRLRDDAWQVREVVLLTAVEYGISLPAALLEDACHDESAAVRQAAREAREHCIRAQDTPSWLSRVLPFVERKKTAMSVQTDPARTAQPPSITARRRSFSPLKAGTLVATLVLALGVLSAAGYSLGWWFPLLGNAAQYTPINQEQTINGVTVRLLKVYLDKGRTVVVYDILSPSADPHSFVDGGSTITSTYPQKTGALPGGGEVQIDKQDPRLRHLYTVYRPFVVPADVSTLRVTWTLEVFQPNETLPKVAPQPLSFTFSFTAPFHQVDNQQIIDPFKSGAAA